MTKLNTMRLLVGGLGLALLAVAVVWPFDCPNPPGTLLSSMPIIQDGGLVVPNGARISFSDGDDALLLQIGPFDEYMAFTFGDASKPPAPRPCRAGERFLVARVRYPDSPDGAWFSACVVENQVWTSTKIRLSQVGERIDFGPGAVDYLMLGVDGGWHFPDGSPLVFPGAP